MTSIAPIAKKLSRAEYSVKSLYIGFTENFIFGLPIALINARALAALLK
jgi:hypothetical protein